MLEEHTQGSFQLQPFAGPSGVCLAECVRLMLPYKVRLRMSCQAVGRVRDWLLCAFIWEEEMRRKGKPGFPWHPILPSHPQVRSSVPDGNPGGRAWGVSVSPRRPFYAENHHLVSPFFFHRYGPNLIKSLISHYLGATHATAFTCQHAWPLLIVVVIITLARQVQ